MPTSLPLPYTASPYRLLLADLVLWARITFVWPPWAGIPSILLPIYPFRSGKLDELYPTLPNLESILYHLLLVFLQGGFLLSLIPAAVLGIGIPFLPPFISCYTPIWFLWVIGFFLGNRWFSVVLNGRLSKREFFSSIPLSDDEKERTSKEKWIFVNGVAAGEHWMQSNLDRLSLTFRREVYGIHNQTRGILFDLLECIVERVFSYPTPSTRMVYSRLMDIVSNTHYERIVLVLHSQGAIEGGLALDWLFATLPIEQVSRVEVYTFGSAANHFNNPSFSSMDGTGKRIDLDPPLDGRVIRHIEHYANSGDYVSKFGILAFRPMPGRSRRFGDPMLQEAENRYFGRLFIRYGSGHQLNGNYLDDIFLMDKNLTRVLDQNPFMDSTIDPDLLKSSEIVVSEGKNTACGVAVGPIKMRDREVVNGTAVPKVKEVSRLWQYRNGGVPSDSAPVDPKPAPQR